MDQGDERAGTRTSTAETRRPGRRARPADTDADTPASRIERLRLMAIVGLIAVVALGPSPAVRAWIASLGRPAGLDTPSSTDLGNASANGRTMSDDAGPSGPGSRPRAASLSGASMTPRVQPTLSMASGDDTPSPVTAYNPLGSHTAAGDAARDHGASRAVPALPPDGEAGLTQALRDGKLRLATGSDLARWKTRWMETHHRSLGIAFDERAMMMRAYMVQGDFEIPPGLTGVHAVVFLHEGRYDTPHGPAGDSAILEIASGDCRGMICAMLVQ